MRAKQLCCITLKCCVTAGFGELEKKVVNPLKGRKIGAYYGCPLLRPAKGDEVLITRKIRRSSKTFIAAPGVKAGEISGTATNAAADMWWWRISRHRRK